MTSYQKALISAENHLEFRVFTQQEDPGEFVRVELVLHTQTNTGLFLSLLHMPLNCGVSLQKGTIIA